MYNKKLKYYLLIKILINNFFLTIITLEKRREGRLFSNVIIVRKKLGRTQPGSVPTVNAPELRSLPSASPPYLTIY